MPWRGPGTLDEVLHRLARRAQLPQVRRPMIARVDARASGRCGWSSALGPVVALLAAGPAGHPPRVLLVVLVAVLSIAHARLARVAVGIAAPGARGGAGGAWPSGDAVSAWALVAAAGLLASHVAALLAAYGPDGLRGGSGHRCGCWAARAAAGLAGRAGRCGPLTLVVRGRPELPRLWVAGLAVALVVTVVATLAVPRRSDDA